MPSLHFADRLQHQIRAKRTPLVVGIDPRVEWLPGVLASSSTDAHPRLAERVSQYSRELIDAVADLVPAIKPQAAFFELLGPHGCLALAEVVDHARNSGLLVVMDAKRGDIGSTAAAYAEAYLGSVPPSAWGCDALTVNPYLGADTLIPFVDTATRTGSGLYVLARTSNPGSDWIQGQNAGSQDVFELVADHIEQLSAAHLGECGYGHVGAVIGATYPEQLQTLRQRMPHTLFLIPGFGAQGGGAADVAGGLDDNGFGALINSSRAINFAYRNPQYEHFSQWTDAVRQATVDAIEIIADGTSAGKLRSRPA